MNILHKLYRQRSETHHCTIEGSDESMSFLPPLKKRATSFQRFRRSLRKSILISEYNPRSTEYYRSKSEILRIRKEQVESRSFIIHPFSEFRAYYEMWMVLVWLSAILYAPLDAAFDFFNPGKDNLSLTTSDVTAFRKDKDLISLGLKILCIIDIILTFLTGYPVKKRRRVIMKPVKIAKNYIVSFYFVSDVLASIPAQIFGKSEFNQRVILTFGYLRIIRLPTLASYTLSTMEVFKLKSICAHIFRNVMLHYLVFHWFACFHYMVPQIRIFTEGEILAESWIEKADLPELDFLSRYIVCLYRAAGSLFCITFEETGIEVWEEKLVAILTFIFGKVYVFYVTVLLLNYLLRQRSLEIKYFETISQVQAYMSQKQLPIPMQLRLLQFYDYKYNKKFFKERAISSLLSEKLKGEINLNVCSKLVQNVSLLAHLPPQTLEQVVTNLKPEIYLANDIIIKAGSVGDCMYFLESGTVGVWTPSGKEVCHLQDGAYFGEISLVFKDKRRTANIVAIEICEVYKLDRKAFRNCFKTNAELFKILEEVANERMEITQMFEDVHAKTFLELGH